MMRSPLQVHVYVYIHIYFGIIYSERDVGMPSIYSLHTGIPAHYTLGPLTTHEHIYIYICIFMYIHTYVYACIKICCDPHRWLLRIYICICIYIYMYIYMYILTGWMIVWLAFQYIERQR